MSKILIADDSAIVVKVQSTILRSHGHEVVVARDGIEAVQAVYTQRPDLVLLDIFMPRMNGYQVCRLLQNDATVAGMPIVINTASDAREAEFWSLHTGADAFLFKGAAPAELLGIVERLLQEKPADPHKPIVAAPDAEEILCRISALADRELYNTTVQRVHLQTMLENLCEGILLLDNQGRVSSANRFLCRLLGTSEDQVTGRTLTEVLGDSAGAIADEMFAAALTQSQQSQSSSLSPIEPRDSIVCDPTTGKATPIALNVAIVRDHLGEIVGCVGVVQDVTRRKEVEALNQLKNDLTTMIVHDLRTPLTSLLTGLQSFEFVGDVNDLQQELLDIALSGGQTLLAMINDLLDISKMEDGSLRLERRELSPHNLAACAMKQVAPLAAAKQLNVSHSIAEGVTLFWGDEDKLERTLVNLPSNAIKFTPQAGHVTLSIGAQDDADTENQSLRFAVQDSGEGIPESAFERIFEKFGQSKTRQAGRKMSTGLGLTFCKMTIEAHGGQIGVQSVLRQGSTFSFTLPFRAPIPNADAADTAETASRDRRMAPIVAWPHPEPRLGPRDRRTTIEAEAATPAVEWDRPAWF